MSGIAAKRRRQTDTSCEKTSPNVSKHQVDDPSVVVAIEQHAARAWPRR